MFNFPLQDEMRAVFAVNIPVVVVKKKSKYFWCTVVEH